MKVKWKLTGVISHRPSIFGKQVLTVQECRLNTLTQEETEHVRWRDATDRDLISMGLASVHNDIRASIIDIKKREMQEGKEEGE